MAIPVGLYHQASGLIDYNQVLIFIQNVIGNMDVCRHAAKIMEADLLKLWPDGINHFNTALILKK
jgi:hypothetical protein